MYYFGKCLRNRQDSSEDFIEIPCNKGSNLGSIDVVVWSTAKWLNMKC